jgi:PAS domain S-box-containing protein
MIPVMEKLGLACRNCELNDIFNTQRLTLDATFNSSFQLSFLIDTQGKIFSANQTALQAIQKKEEDIVHLPFYEADFFLSKPQKEIIKEYVEKALSGQTILTETSFFTGQKIITIELVIKPVFNTQDQVSFLVAEAWDISQNIALQQKSEYEQLLLKTVIEIIPDALYVKDKNKRKILSNPADLKNIGLSESEVLGKNDYELYPPDVADKFDADDSKVIATGQPIIEREEYLVNKNQTGKWILTSKIPLKDTSGNVEGLVGVGRDITESKKMMEELKYRAEFEKLLVGFSAKFISSNIEDLDGNINDSLKAIGTFCNTDRAYIFLFDEPGKVMSNTHEWCAPGISPEIDNLQLIPSEIFPQWIATLLRFDNVYIPSVEDLPEEWEAERQILEPQGILSTVSVPLIVEENLIGFAGFDSVQNKRSWSEEDIKLLRIFGDLLAVSIDRRWKAEKITKYNHNLEKINEELNRFAYIVSHDLKAPLRAINNLSEWIEEDIGEQLQGETKEQFGMLRGRVRRLEDLINGILEYSRIGRVKSKVEAGQVDKIVQRCTDKFKDNPNAKFIIKGKETHISSELNALESVICHLVSNAVKYGDKALTEVEISWKDLGKVLEFNVKDNGPGIPKEFYEKIFLMFQTLKARDEFESTGVGLAIIKKIIEDKNCDIWVESQVGEGSNFKFTWPKYELRETLLNV